MRVCRRPLRPMRVEPRFACSIYAWRSQPCPETGNRKYTCSIYTWRNLPFLETGSTCAFSLILTSQHSAVSSGWSIWTRERSVYPFVGNFWSSCNFFQNLMTSYDFSSLDEWLDKWHGSNQVKGWPVRSSTKRQRKQLALLRICTTAQSD